MRVVAGITPAYAGKRRHAQDVETRLQDHPRLCGEKLAARAGRALVDGSPPPMRGKGPAGALAHADVGITPAYAGKSSTSYKHRHCNWDHPRLCGEKQA